MLLAYHVSVSTLITEHMWPDKQDQTKIFYQKI